MNNIIDDDFMREEYTKDDICNLRKNPYAKSFTPVDKLKVFLDAFIKENNIYAKMRKKNETCASI